MPAWAAAKAAFPSWSSRLGWEFCSAKASVARAKSESTIMAPRTATRTTPSSSPALRRREIRRSRFMSASLLCGVVDERDLVLEHGGVHRGVGYVADAQRQADGADAPQA